MYNFDPYSVLLVIATNIPQWLKTGFVLQGHIYNHLVSKAGSVISSKSLSTTFRAAFTTQSRRSLTSYAKNKSQT